jgi:hypothetical protein
MKCSASVVAFGLIKIKKRFQSKSGKDFLIFYVGDAEFITSSAFFISYIQKNISPIKMYIVTGALSTSKMNDGTQKNGSIFLGQINELNDEANISPVVSQSTQTTSSIETE